jgi:hypothetical protein
MTEHEITLARALASCGMLPGSSIKRFVRSMAHQADHEPLKDISLRQRHYMELAAWRFRRQLPPHLVPHCKPLNLPPAVRRLPAAKASGPVVRDTARPPEQMDFRCIWSPATN